MGLKSSVPCAALIAGAIAAGCSGASASLSREVAPALGEHTSPAEAMARGLIDAILGGNRREYERLIQAGARADLLVALPSEDVRLLFGFEGKVTPLIIAAMNEDETYLRLALEHGADPSVVAEGRSGSAFERSMWSRRDKNFRMLLRRGAGLDVPDSDGLTPLDAAVLVNRFDYALLLLDAGARPELVSRGGRVIARKLCIDVPYTKEAAQARDELKKRLTDHGLKLECP